MADLIGIHTGDYLITEAGFGADMGAERFFNIKCRVSGPGARRRRRRHHRAGAQGPLGRPTGSWPAGRCRPPSSRRTPTRCGPVGANLVKQIENVRLHGVTPVVAINAFPGDHPSRVRRHPGDRRLARRALRGHHPLRRRRGRRHRAGRGRGGGGRGARASSGSSTRRRRPCARRSRPSPPGSTGPTGWTTRPRRPAGLDQLEAEGFGGLSVCIAKTHLSISSFPDLKGAPTGWRLPVREVRLSAGAGFVYAICGDMRTMPGLGSHPAAFDIDLDEDGNVVGLY